MSFHRLQMASLHVTWPKLLSIASLATMCSLLIVHDMKGDGKEQQTDLNVVKADMGTVKVDVREIWQMLSHQRALQMRP